MTASLRVLLLSISCAVTKVAAQPVGAPQLFMAFVDYGAFHNQLVTRCASQFPNTAEPLRTAISAWSARTQPALEELRGVLRDKMVRDGMDKADVDARTAQSAAKVTAFMTNGIAKASEAEMSQTCAGGYAAQLARPEMDYVAFLARVKAELKR